ncbi:MAG TPA: serine/threonine-protein kinase [Myxococcales bacterium]|nr:serine/threonine-protein kinase [Myxococcales bacterium]
MTRWQKVQELFHAAADQAQADRQAFLQAACGEDQGLAAEVLALLAEDGGSSPLDRNIAQLASEVLTGPEITQLGEYRIERKLGEGGTGIVYLAEQQKVGRKVALKVLRDAWLSPSRRERFAAEQRTLAQLDHPSIARIYDAGFLADGTPYFVMEYVEGKPLTEWCRGVGLAEKLRLFRALCKAVQSAHAHGVVHRDLKPSNVLVKEDGSPRLLDFGIAKQLAGNADLTRTGMRLYTPAYAAPEQFRGAAAGVRADIYSLGVVLYELLAQRQPFDLSGCTPAEAEELILHREPPKPSAVAPSGAASRAAWADLDVLILKAMHKDPGRRYASVEALMRDLDHHLRFEALEARPDELSYRLRKLAGRNRRPVALSVAAAAIALAGAIFFTVRLVSARDAALAEAAQLKLTLDSVSAEAARCRAASH